jgi:dihydroflavonol-4-reductase
MHPVDQKRADMTTRVLVTGISGYIGQHVGAELLRQGYEVVGSVRSTAKVDPTRKAIETVAPVDNLSFVEADLLSDNGWDEAIAGCTYVMHVASPFVMSAPADENELITPAVEGTKRVILAAQRAGVKRLVLTSSTVAIISGQDNGRYGPDAWSDANARIGAYSKSKTLAERAAWDINRDNAMELTVINPGGVFGPSLGAQPDSASVMMVSDLVNGKMPMIPDLALGMVDVRDVARLHVTALTATQAAGQRFIAASEEPIEMASLAATLKQAGYAKVPSRKAPKFLLQLMSLFNGDVRTMLPLIGKRIYLDNTATFEVLGWQPTPVEESITEMAASLSK